jgi:hypothetical protein
MDKEKRVSLLGNEKWSPGSQYRLYRQLDKQQSGYAILNYAVQSP